MKFLVAFLSTIFITSIKCDLNPLECLPQAERLRGFTFCQFGNQSSADQDVTKVKVAKNSFQGRLIESSQVTAILISFSDFDHIPNSVFQNFGDVTRLKISNSKIAKIDRDDFSTASHLRVLEIENSEIGTVSSNAFGLLKNLEKIEIENCKFDKFSNDALDGLEKLTIIKVENNTYHHSKPNIKNKNV
ncbi:hypothetical protein PVAND_007931 [Polypedilum vanderplanki]|uniref:Uncharacterized protein n=1 Tax=Polypedilum vanderplanki TaxID=319348 RepID=A0A9J6C8D0_POLVA|nr:hypothetical protein PVAND_007931 [Polypedilum vanderplanki]